MFSWIAGRLNVLVVICGLFVGLIGVWCLVACLVGFGCFSGLPYRFVLGVACGL